jgi:hypothetical protein
MFTIFQDQNYFEIHPICYSICPFFLLATRKSIKSYNQGITSLVVRGSITVPSTTRQTSSELAVVDVNKYFLYKQAKLAYQEVDGVWYFSMRVFWYSSYAI